MAQGVIARSEARLMYMIDIVHTALTVGVALIGVSAVLLADGLQTAGAHPPSRSIGKTAPSAT